ncbi:heptaprenylglyceryl phosphate synthase [Listeria costaricensis]|uniref:heptaprenylglyceryl phosphate synthase n=1 Tax=Listeria costaricensis TaxID=2026604 RepID=UPI0019698D18|nr:heptaprenylglyceryl phosphate synthase [Listeria costaricensis]
MRHFFKIDPAKELSEKAVHRLLTSGTDGFIVGGTDGLTAENVSFTYDLFSESELPVYLEVSSEAAILPYADRFLIPSVLNTQETEWLIGRHHQVAMEYGKYIPWNKTSTQGYIILNEEAKAARLAKADTALSIDAIQAYARLAEHVFHLPIVYLEYSGRYGNPAVVQAVREVLGGTTELWYGGGIQTLEQAVEMGHHADVIVVGNSLYEDFESAIETTQARCFLPC